MTCPRSSCSPRSLGRGPFWRASLGGLSLIAVLGLGGCELFKKTKIPLKGKREPVVVFAPGMSDAALKGVGGIVLAPLHAPTPWLQPEGSASHDLGGWVFPDGAWEPLWRASFASGGADARILAAPVTNATHIFMMDGEGVVSCTDLKTGDGVWQYSALPEDKAGSPVLGGGCALDGSTVFATTAYGDLVALNAKDGTLIWRKALRNPARSAPALAEGRVFVVTLQNQLDVFDSATGKKLWSHFGLPEGLGVLGLSTPAVSGDVVVVAYTSGEVVALNVRSGQVLWSEVIPGPRHASDAQSVSHIRANPVIHGSTVYVMTYNGQTVALNLRDGRHLWEAPLGGIETPVRSGNALFVLVDGDKVYALEAESGRVMQRLSLTDLASDKESAAVRWMGPLLLGDSLWVFAENGRCVALDPRTLKPQPKEANLHLSGPLALRPLVGPGTLYALTTDATLHATGVRGITPK